MPTNPSDEDIPARALEDMRDMLTLLWLLARQAGGELRVSMPCDQPPADLEVVTWRDPATEEIVIRAGRGLARKAGRQGAGGEADGGAAGGDRPEGGCEAVGEAVA